VFIYSVGVFITVHRVRKTIGKLLKNKHVEESHNAEHEWIKSRTIHVRGLDTGDRTGIALATVLNEFLKTRGGSVLDVQILPDYQSMLELEVKRSEAECMKRLCEQHPEAFSNFCFSGS
jgi:hypothetical protein